MAEESQPKKSTPDHDPSGEDNESEWEYEYHDTETEVSTPLILFLICITCSPPADFLCYSGYLFSLHWQAEHEFIPKPKKQFSKPRCIGKHRPRSRFSWHTFSTSRSKWKCFDAIPRTSYGNSSKIPKQHTDSRLACYKPFSLLRKPTLQL